MIYVGISLACIRDLSLHFLLVNLLLVHPTNFHRLASSHFSTDLFAYRISSFALISVCLLNAALLFANWSVLYLCTICPCDKQILLFCNFCQKKKNSIWVPSENRSIDAVTLKICDSGGIFFLIIGVPTTKAQYLSQ